MSFNRLPAGTKAEGWDCWLDREDPPVPYTKKHDLPANNRKPCGVCHISLRDALFNTLEYGARQGGANLMLTHQPKCPGPCRDLKSCIQVRATTATQLHIVCTLVDFDL